MSSIKILRVENSIGRGMYSGLWYQLDLPEDRNHPSVGEDSKYQEDLLEKVGRWGAEPSGHRFGFLDEKMLRRWIYSDQWIELLSQFGAVLCVYEVAQDSVVIGRTQITFDFEKAVCVERKPLASLLERA